MKWVAIALCALVCGCSGTAPSAAFSGTANAPSTHCPDNNVWEQDSNPRLLTTPEIHTIFWGSWWLDDGLSQYDAMAIAWNILGNDPNFYAPLAQYGISPGSMVGTYTTNYDLAGGGLTEAYIQTELVREINAGILPAADSNSIYVIELPQPDYSIQDVGEAVGHHGIVNGIPYAVIEYSNVIQMNAVSSHEIYEGSTDPDLISGWWEGSGETEIADFCVGNYYSLDNYVIQQVWNQQACACGP